MGVINIAAPPLTVLLPRPPSPIPRPLVHRDTAQRSSALLGKELGCHGSTGGSVLADEGAQLEAEAASPEPIWGQGQCQGHGWFPETPCTLQPLSVPPISPPLAPPVPCNPSQCPSQCPRWSPRFTQCPVAPSPQYPPSVPPMPQQPVLPSPAPPKPGHGGWVALPRTLRVVQVVTMCKGWVGAQFA